MKSSRLDFEPALKRMNHLAGEAWRRCDFASAIQIVDRARRIAPSNVIILLDLGVMHGLRYDYAAAERCFEKAIRLAPHNPDMLLTVAERCRDFKRLDLAQNYLNRALEQSTDSATILAKQAELSERLRRSDEAESLVDRALRSDPACAAALLLRAKLDRQAGRMHAAETVLRQFPVTSAPNLRASAMYELGAILDRDGRYDEAMAAWLEAKTMLKSQADKPVAELKIMRARINHMVMNASTALLNKWSATSDELEPTYRLALLGGHPRSGTTLLEQVLDSHPEILSAEETDIFYSDAYGPMLRGYPDNSAMLDSLSGATLPRLAKSRHDYFRTMALSLRQPVLGKQLIDKNPSYTFLIPALIRIFPEIKLLVTLRDPRDVILSCFAQDFPLNQVGAAFLSLESTVQEYTAMMGAWQLLKLGINNDYLEVRYEDMVSDLESVARKTLDFLGCKWDAAVLSFNQHASRKVVHSPTYSDVTKPVYRQAVGRWRHYHKHFEQHLGVLEPFAKAFGYD